MKILFLSHTVDGGTFKVGSHHLAREFAVLGHEVIHVSTPLAWPQLRLGHGDPKRVELARSGPRRDEYGVTHVVGVVPVPLRLARQTSRVLDIIEGVGARDADIVFVDEPLMAPAARYLSDGSLVVYRPTDIYVDGPRASRQAAILAHVGAVIATSPVVLDSLRLPPRVPAIVVENGVAIEQFRMTTDMERNGAVYVGALDDRFDWDAVRTMAAAAPELQIDLYGPMNGTRALPENVRSHGPIAYADVPTVLARAQLGLLPFTRSQLNEGRSPMKFYEYLAAGLNVLASATPVLCARKAPGAVLYKTTAEIPQMLHESLSLVSPNLRGRDEAARQGWTAKAAEILEFARGAL